MEWSRHSGMSGGIVEGFHTGKALCRFLTNRQQKGGGGGRRRCSLFVILGIFLSLGTVIHSYTVLRRQARRQFPE